jgi:hypothetical protein
MDKQAVAERQRRETVLTAQADREAMQVQHLTSFDFD